MDAPRCPKCGEPIDKVVDVPYGWWEWNGAKYELKTAASARLYSSRRSDWR